MCGITGYIGKKEGLQIVFSNLRKLEYRGYDSAGVAYFAQNGGAPALISVKRPGKLDALEKEIYGRHSLAGTAAIAHTRWATHGAPTEKNAHPHSDCNGEIFLVHNGIIENYSELKNKLIKLGHKFRSETDTEVVPHLIEEHRKTLPTLEAAFAATLRELRGAYAFAVVAKSEPGAIYIARLGSPMVLGLGEDEYFIASDPTALAGLVRKVLYVKDGTRGKITCAGPELGRARQKIEPLEIDASSVDLGGFPHYMLKEIFEGPDVVRAALVGRLKPSTYTIKLGGLQTVEKKLKKIKHLQIIACGTSYYAGMVGKMLFEELLGIPAEAALASEYRYGTAPFLHNTAGIFISQSGETADTLAALRKMNSEKSLTLGVVNVVGSSIARETTAGVYNRAGAEIGVASTKAFLSQLTVLNLISASLAPRTAKTLAMLRELWAIPQKIETILGKSKAIRALAKKYSRYNNFIYLGRGYNYPSALEGALKLKEISYAHAEGYAGGEMKHGPLALIDKRVPTFAIATKNSLYEKMISNISEVKARGGRVIAVATTGDRAIKKLVDDVIYVPATSPQLEPMLTVVPLQLFAYYCAVLRGRNVDKPRNLAKSVTVE